MTPIITTILSPPRRTVAAPTLSIENNYSVASTNLTASNTLTHLFKQGIQTENFNEKIATSLEYMLSKYAPGAPSPIIKGNLLPTGPFQFETLMNLLPNVDIEENFARSQTSRRLRENVTQIYKEKAFHSLITNAFKCNSLKTTIPEISLYEKADLLSIKDNPAACEQLLYFFAGIDHSSTLLELPIEFPESIKNIIYSFVEIHDHTYLKNYLSLMLKFQNLPKFYGPIFNALYSKGYLESFPKKHANIIKKLKFADTEKRFSFIFKRFEDCFKNPPKGLLTPNLTIRDPIIIYVGKIDILPEEKKANENRFIDID